MATISTNMSLTCWTDLGDFFSNTELANNFTAIDEHDHTSGKGVQIPAGGIGPAAVTATAIASNAVTTAKIADDAVTSDKLGTNSVLHDALGSIPACRVYKDTTTACGDAALVGLTFNQERYDTDSMHSTSIDSGRITFNSAGVYHVGAHIEWAANSTGRRLIGLRLNGSTFICQASQNGVTTVAATTVQSIGTDYKFSASDYVEVMVLQNSGGSLNVSSSPEFFAHFVSKG